MVSEELKETETAEETAPLLRLDFGCGNNKKEGFTGVDNIKFDAVDVVLDVANDQWPWADGTVDEINASHFVEHLTQDERVKFFNECYRVLKPNCKLSVVCPHWASTRAYGDPTHKWPAFCEMACFYLNKEWRLGKDGVGANAPHTDITFNPNGFSCDFGYAWGYSMGDDLAARNPEYQMEAFQNNINAAQDILCEFTAIKPL